MKSSVKVALSCGRGTASSGSALASKVVVVLLAKRSSS